VAYESRYLRDILRGENVNLPFFWTESASNRLTFVAGAQQHDDMTLVALRVTSEQDSPAQHGETRI
jgi:hypothetical protein